MARYMTNDVNSRATKVHVVRALVSSIRLSPIASIVTDARAADNPIIAANGQFELLTGYAENELIGRNCRILTGPDTDPLHSAALRLAVETATPRLVELINYRKDGSKFVNAVMVAPVFGNDGEASFFVGSQMEVDSQYLAQSATFALERIGRLTTQQQSVLRLMARGMRNREIGQQMGLAEKTIKMHRSALVKRLGFATAAQALRLAIEAGF